MSIFSHITRTACFFSVWTKTCYQKLSSSFVIRFLTLLVLSMTLMKITRGQEISLTVKKDFHSFIPSLINDHLSYDTLFDNRGTKQIQLLNKQFVSEKKENNITIQDQNIRLLQQQGKIERANLKQAALKQSIATACAAFFIIVVGLVYVHYCRKKKDNGIITEQNKELKRLIEEKEWLVKEIHHRVTNNLHIIISLLESQAMFLRDDALKAIKISQHRIYAMLLIHQKLYRSDDIKTIDMKIYLAELIQYLENGFTINIEFSI